MNNQNLTNAKNLLDIEFNNSMKEKSNTWEFHQLCLVIGELKVLIEKLNNPNELIRANKIYKKIKEGKL